jgi:hypothetical protein
MLLEKKQRALDRRELLVESQEGKKCFFVTGFVLISSLLQE